MKKRISTQKNQYVGINAHLHSYWQAEGGWHNFHNRHIGDLTGLLRQQLLPLGYTASMEESLQIRHLELPTSYPRADILITDLNPPRSFSSAMTATTALSVADLLEADADLEKPYYALVVYEGGEPVAWIELLSPSNKGYGADAQQYVMKRRQLLEAGIVFVELDYLHRSPPTFPRLLDYSDPQEREQGACPYRIILLDPRPDIYQGGAYPFEFRVDDPIPPVTIPLRGADQVAVDFGLAYRKTFEEMAYGLELVDYHQIPLQFESYNQDDQFRIVWRMLTVLATTQKGDNLEVVPLPLVPAPSDLQTALEQLEV